MEEDSFDCDVVIVGGGPAGVSCAITVVKAGFSVIIVDKKPRQEIGDKTCGDAIDKDGLKRVVDEIGISYPENQALSDPISKMSVAAQSIDEKITLDAPGFVVDRLEYGQILLKQAEELGVQIIDRAPVRDIIVKEIDHEKFVNGVIYNKAGKKEQITAKFTIDASGAYASIRKLLPEEAIQDGMKRELDDNEYWPTYREIIQLKEGIPDHKWPQEILLMFSDDFPPPGYFWIFTKGRSQLNVGIGWQKDQDLGKIKDKYVETLSRYYTPDQYTVIKRGGGQIPFRIPFDNNVFNGGALVGDAGCMVHPLTAEGHAPALNSGMILGKAIIKALKTNRRDSVSLWEYNVNIAHHYGRKHAEAYIMKEFLKNIGAKGLHYIIAKKAFKEDELNLIFSGQPFTLSTREKLKRLMILIRKPRLIVGMATILSQLKSTKEHYQNYPLDQEGLESWRTKRNAIVKADF